MIFHEVCEASALFLIFQAYFEKRDFKSLEAAAAEQGVSQDDWKRFIAYAGTFYANMGSRHRGFAGAKKQILPDFSPETFKKILLSNPLHSADNEGGVLYREIVDELCPSLPRLQEAKTGAQSTQGANLI